MYKLFSACLYIFLISVQIIACKTTNDKNQIQTLVEQPRQMIDPKTVPYSEFVNWRESFNNKIEANTQKSRNINKEEMQKEANQLLSRGERRKAKAYFNQLVREDAKNKEALIELASIYIEENQVEESFSILMQIRNMLNNEIRNDKSFLFRYRFTLAVAHLKRKEHQQGHKYLSKLIADDPTFSPAYSTLAGNYILLNKLKTAEFVAKRGIEKSGNDANLLNLLGVIERKRGSLDLAETWFNKALEIDPNHIPSLVNRASINVIRYEYEAANKDVGKALSINPFSIDALVLASILLHKQEQFEPARDILYKVLDLDPENSSARYNLALIEEKLNQLTTARRLIEEVLQLETEKSELRDKALSKLVDLAPNLD